MERKNWGNHGGSAVVSDITDLWLSVWARFLSISVLVYFFSPQSGQEVYCEDWLQTNLHWCFFPFCPQSSLCLDSQQETTAFRDYSQIYTLTVFAYLFRLKVQSCFWDVSEGPCSFKNVSRFEIWSSLALSVWFEEQSMTQERFSCLTSRTGWWIIPDLYLEHISISGASGGCLKNAAF